MPTAPITRRNLLVGASTLVAAGAVAPAVILRAAAQQPPQLQAPAPTTEQEAQAIVQEAYVYLYPLVLMDITREQMINSPPGALGGPVNAFTNVRAFPTAEMRTVVRPNFDTLYSSAWLDLTGGPVIVSNPDTNGRYFLLPMLDMWTDVFAVPGKRTTGTGAANYAVVPPGWDEPLPDDVERIDAPTPNVWIIGRTQTNGVADYDAVHRVQDGYRITLLDDWGRTPRQIEQRIDPSVDIKTPPLRQIGAMPAEDFYRRGLDLMAFNPPHLTDWSTVARMRRIGLVAGQDFNLDGIGREVLASGARAGLQLLREQAATIARVTNGWQMNTTTMGVHGNYYLKRAMVAMVGLGANQPEDAVYPFNVSDALGKPVMGEHNYVVHFENDELPPADAFWSLTMYDAEGFQVANALNRFALGDRDPLKFGPDGSLDLYIQASDPGGDKTANWLPSPPSGELGLTLRLYAPRPEVLQGKWNPPPVRQVS